MAEQRVAKLSVLKLVAVSLIMYTILGIIFGAAMVGAAYYVSNVGTLDSFFKTMDDILGFRVTSGWVGASIVTTVGLCILFWTIMTAVWTTVYNITARLTGGIKMEVNDVKKGEKADKS